MKHRLNYLFLVFSVGLLAFAVAPASIPFEDGRESPIKSLAKALFGGPSLVNSSEEILMGYRSFDGDIQDGRLSFHGAAFTFLDADDPSTFIPYNFAFDGTAFRELPEPTLAAEFYARNDAAFPTVSGVDLQSCVQPRADSGTTADGTPLALTVLCRIVPAIPGNNEGMIGVVYPADDSTPLADGDATCRGEFQHWRSFPGFENKTIVLCAVVDRTFVEDAYSATRWMDVIFYQHYAGELYNMRADTRNFQRIR